MGNSAAAFLAIYHCTYHTPSIWVIPFISLSSYGCWRADMPWWAILVQSLGGATAALGLLFWMPTTEPGAPTVRWYAMPMAGTRFLLHFICTVVGCLSYGFIYFTDLNVAHMIDPHHVLQPWHGPLTATILSLATDAMIHWARRNWVDRRSYTPAKRWVSFACISITVACIDMCVHADHWSTYLMMVALLVLGMQLAIAPVYNVVGDKLS